MKQKDFTLIIVVVFISAVLALIASNLFFSSPHNRQQTAEVVDVIVPDFNAPSSKYFNAQSIDPTQQIQIGNSSNPTPFNSKP
ncbi:MAG TPA: hypothetical protein VL737_02625 [Candidatus Pristimantibacillus sp.]|nr:hypothetical protein [Candidatus Pristimantibacillus sp.]